MEESILFFNKDVTVMNHVLIVKSLVDVKLLVYIYTHFI